MMRKKPFTGTTTPERVRKQWGACRRGLVTWSRPPGATSLPAGSGAGGAARRLRPQHLRPELAATDLVATIYYALGISADLELRDHFNWPFPVVPGGMPVTKLFA